MSTFHGLRCWYIFLCSCLVFSQLCRIFKLYSINRLACFSYPRSHPSASAAPVARPPLAPPLRLPFFPGWVLQASQVPACWRLAAPALLLPPVPPFPLVRFSALPALRALAVPPSPPVPGRSSWPLPLRRRRSGSAFPVVPPRLPWLLPVAGFRVALALGRSVRWPLGLAFRSCCSSPPALCRRPASALGFPSAVAGGSLPAGRQVCPVPCACFSLIFMCF